MIQENGDINLGWLIGRPIAASVGMALVTPIVTKFFFAPMFRRYIEYHFARFDHISNIILMVLVLSAFISIAAYTGTSVLFGSFLAGTFLSYIPSKHPEGPFVVMSREEGERETDKSPTFIHTFERYLLDVQKYLMEPLFFASMGFAIPFVQLWTGKRIWRGIVFTLLMIFAKVRFTSIRSSLFSAHTLQFIVGIWIPLWDCVSTRNVPKLKAGPIVQGSPEGASRELNTGKSDRERTWLSGLLLGSAMVARGEIGLLIIEIGYNNTSYVTQEGFITGVWAILLNTIIGPVIVGLLVKYYGKRIAEGQWGLQNHPVPSLGH